MKDIIVNQDQIYGSIDLYIPLSLDLALLKPAAKKSNRKNYPTRKKYSQQQSKEEEPNDPNPNIYLRSSFFGKKNKTTEKWEKLPEC